MRNGTFLTHMVDVDHVEHRVQHILEDHPLVGRKNWHQTDGLTSDSRVIAAQSFRNLEILYASTILCDMHTLTAVPPQSKWLNWTSLLSLNELGILQGKSCEYTKSVAWLRSSDIGQLTQTFKYSAPMTLQST